MSSFLKDLYTAATDLAKDATDFALNKTDLEKKLDEVLSDKNYGTPTSALREIAAATSYHADFNVIMTATWTTMNPSSHSWRQVYKALTLLESLIKFGGERCVDDAREHAFRVRELSNFQQVIDGKDQGAGIREKAKRITELLGDTSLLREERKKAKEMVNKFVGISNEGSTQYSSSSSSSNQQRFSGNSSSGGRRSSYGSSSRGGGGTSDYTQWGNKGVSQDELHAPPSGYDSNAFDDSRFGGGSTSERGNNDDEWTSRGGVDDFQSNNNNKGVGGKVGGRRHGTTTAATASFTSTNTATDDFDAFGGGNKNKNNNNNTSNFTSDFDSFGTSSSSSSSSSTTTTTNNNNSSFGDFDAFGASPSPAPSSGSFTSTSTRTQSTSSTAVPSFNVGSSMGSLRHPTQSVQSAPTLAPPRLSAPPSTSNISSATSSDPFSNFGGGGGGITRTSTTTTTTTQQNAQRPVATTSGIDDLFGVSTSTSTSSLFQNQTVPVVAAAAASFDPFASPAPASSMPMSSGGGGGGVFGAQSAANPFGSSIVFGANSTSPTSNGITSSGVRPSGPKDDDLDRLVNLSLGDTSSSSKSSMSGNIAGKAPLKALGQQQPLSMGGMIAGSAAIYRPGVMLSQQQPMMMMGQQQQPIQQQQMQWGNMPATGMGMSGGFSGGIQQQQQSSMHSMQTRPQQLAFNPADPFA